MFKSRWLLALPLVLASTMVSAAQGATIRDGAGMFSPEAVNQASTRLQQIERESRMPVTVETIDSLNGRDIDQVVVDHARRARARGLYVLIVKKEHRIEGAVSQEFRGAFSTNRILSIRSAFISKMKAGEPDAALQSASEAIGREVAQAQAANGGTLRGASPVPVPGVPGGRPRSGLGSLLTIGLLIVGGLFLIRLLGRLFSGNRGYGAAGPGRMMGGPGYGPGYGGGGGGFLSSMFGGIGGALAGNWLYDQFSGRHHGGGYTDSTSYGGDQGVSDAGGGDWSTPGDGGGD